MLEIEAKAWCRDPAATRKRMVAKGAKPLHKEREEDVYYQHPCRDLAATDEALRLRRRFAAGGVDEAAKGAALDPDRVTLTYKGPKLDAESKSRRELNLSLPDRDARALLEGLGFRPAARVAKTRETFGLGEIILTLDTVQGVGSFVEVEVALDDEQEEDPQAAFRARRDEVLALLRELGLHDRERRSYLELLLERGGGALETEG